MKGLAPHTQRIFEAVAGLECIKPYNSRDDILSIGVFGTPPENKESIGHAHQWSPIHTRCPF